MARPRTRRGGGSGGGTPPIAPRFVVPFLSEADAQIVGTELEQIAQAQQVNGIRHLDADATFALVESNRRHPMRHLFDWNDKSAARKQRVAYMGKLIMSVRIVRVTVAKAKTYAPMYISAQASVVRQGSIATRRTHVMTPDAYTHDPAFASLVNASVGRLMNELKKLEHTANARPLPANIQQFIDDVRASANTNNIP